MTVSLTFSDTEISEAKQFLNAGEYGLALDTAVEIIVEERKISSADTIEYIQKLADAMNLSNDHYNALLGISSR